MHAHRTALLPNTKLVKAATPRKLLLLQVVAETDEPFVPVPDELIVNLKEGREAVDSLLDNLANTFAATTSVSHLNCCSLSLQSCGVHVRTVRLCMSTLG